MTKLIITPKTKIFDLLQAYPELEQVLIDAAPPFRKLKNPVLRKTVTKITNLGQAAAVAGIPTGDLVNVLRKAAGQDSLEAYDEAQARYITLKPKWFAAEDVTDTIDIREMLNAGEQPVHEVLSRLKHLEKGKILEMVAPFVPAPLLDKTLSLGYLHWLKKMSGEEFRVYFFQPSVKNGKEQS